MRLAMQSHKTLQLQLRRARRGELSADMLRSEDDIGVFLVLENLAVHTPVPALIAAVAGGGVHHERAAGFAGAGIEMNSSTFQLESAVHGVQDISQREFNAALSGIELKNRLLCAASEGEEQDAHNRCGNFQEPSGFQVHGI